MKRLMIRMILEKAANGVLLVRDGFALKTTHEMSLWSCPEIAEVIRGHRAENDQARILRDDRPAATESLAGQLLLPAKRAGITIERECAAILGTKIDQMLARRIRRAHGDRGTC